MSPRAAPDDEETRSRFREPVDFDLIYQTETKLAACFHDEETQHGPLFGGAKPRDIWLPLSEISIETNKPRRRGALVTVTMPKWLAIEKGLA